jgi:hypothetical protein
MEEYYNKNSDDSNFADKIPAHMSVYVNPETMELVFSCDWIDEEENLYFVSEILYQLKYKDLVDKMLENIYKQCVFNNRLEDFNKIKEDIDRKVKLSKGKDELVVSPRDISKF